MLTLVQPAEIRPCSTASTGRASRLLRLVEMTMPLLPLCDQYRSTNRPSRWLPGAGGPAYRACPDVTTAGMECRREYPPQSRARIAVVERRSHVRLRRGSSPVPDPLVDDLRHVFPSPRVDGRRVRQHRPVYLECLIGARDPQLVHQHADIVLVAVPGGVDLHRQHVLRRCACHDETRRVEEGAWPIVPGPAA